MAKRFSTKTYPSIFMARRFSTRNISVSVYDQKVLNKKHIGLFMIRRFSTRNISVSL